MSIQPGQLNQRAVIEQQTAAADSFTERTWAPVATVWASIKAARSAEVQRADAMQAVVSHTVLVHWQRALAVPVESGAWRVRYTCSMSGHEHMLAIVGPARLISDGGAWLIFDCVEGLADGH